MRPHRETITTEGVVLRSLPYRDADKIVTIFSKEWGMMTCLAKGICRGKSREVNLTSPLCLGEFTLFKGRTSLFTLREGTIYSLHRAIRTSLLRLEVGQHFLSAILQREKRANIGDLTYPLLKQYLKALCHFPDPLLLQMSFDIKLMTAQGEFLLEPLCQRCRRYPAHILCGGESCCVRCASPSGESFLKEEWELLLRCGQARQFSKIWAENLPKDMIGLAERIRKMTERGNA